MSDFDDLSIFEMFRIEAEEQVEQLQRLLLALREGGANEATLRTLMRSAHSLKGAARVVGLDAAVRLTHAMEERFVAAQNGKSLGAADVDLQLRATDVLRSLTTISESESASWTEANDSLITELGAQLTGGETAGGEPTSGTAAKEAAPSQEPAAVPEETPAEEDRRSEDRDRRAENPDRRAADLNLRITAQRFDRIIGMSSDNLIQAQGLVRMQETMQRTQKRIEKIVHLLAEYKVGEARDPEKVAAAMKQVIEQGKQQRALLGNMIGELDGLIHQHESNANLLHREVLHARLRPFGELVPNLRRLVRETAARMNKPVLLGVDGEATEVDREILEKLRAPLEHLLTNALDHGLESPEERVRSGKPAEGRVNIRARHENGRLAITLQDDGKGVDGPAVARRAVERGLVRAEVAERLSEAEVLEFLFLPGFSTRTDVSELSGRGFGLDVVQGMVHDAGGSVRIETTPGAGTSFEIELPVTRSLLRVMRVELEGEVYAVPLNRISHIANKTVAVAEGSTPTVESHGESVPAIAMMDALRSTMTPLHAGPAVCLFLLDEKGKEAPFALVLDRVVDELTVAVRQLDPRLGRMAAIAAVTLAEGNVPMLIVEPDDVLRLAVAAQQRMERGSGRGAGEKGSVLVVDDSGTVRQMLRRTLVRARYHVAVAENGADAWNILQLSRFDLLVSDVDMPLMNGIELVERVRANARLGHMPVILLSYKGRDEDRRRGLEAGADAYVTKGEFQEAAFLQVVTDLIGPAELPDDTEPHAP